MAPAATVATNIQNTSRIRLAWLMTAAASIQPVVERSLQKWKRWFHFPNGRVRELAVSVERQPNGSGHDRRSPVTSHVDPVRHRDGAKSPGVLSQSPLVFSFSVIRKADKVIG